MIKDNKDRKALIKYRIDCAYQAKDDADLLIKGERYNASVNRVYYGMFYMLNALALLHKFQTSKHQQLIGWFNKNFIKDKIIPIKYAIHIKNAFNNRNKADYGDFIEINKSEAINLFEDLKDFISKLENYIQKNINNIL